MRALPALGEFVEIPGGQYQLGEPGEERACARSARC